MPEISVAGNRWRFKFDPDTLLIPPESGGFLWMKTALSDRQATL
jgi:hypothetical protein